MVERESFEYNGKECFTYFINAKLRGKELRAKVAPMDVDGFAVLDLVFNNAMEAELKITPFEMKNANGQTVKGNSYSVISKDEDGTVYECSIKPYNKTAKDILAMILR